MFIETSRQRSTWHTGARKLLLTMGAGLLAACGAPLEPASTTDAALVAIGTSEQSLYVDSDEVWGRPNLTVCWDTPGFATEKEWVRTSIRDTWEKESNLVFSGWGACPSSADIRITISDEGPHTEGLGTSIEDEEEGMVLNFTFANWSPSCASSPAQREHCIRAIGVHEFGHALGFAHEHNRGDTPSTCTTPSQGSDGDTHVGAWDLMSVMNYCNPTWNNAGQLSTTDIQGVRQFYGQPRGADQQFHVARVDSDYRADILQTYRGWGSIPTCRSTGSGWTCTNPSATVYNWGSPEQRYVTGDFNGDGRTDLVQTYRFWASYPVCYSTGTGGWSCSNPYADIYNWGTGSQRFITGDFSGDGKTDIAQAYHDSSMLPVCRSTGTGWSCNNPSATLRKTDSPEVRYLSGDFNGDGRDDIAQAYRRWLTQPVCLSTGTAWSCSNPSVAMYDAGNAEQDFLTGDFNGDGRDDILQSYRGWNAMPVCYGMTSATWSCNIPAGTFYNSGSHEQQMLTGDFNGDGRTDIIQTYRGWGSIPTCYSTGSGWSCSNSPATIYNSGSSEQRFMTADVNGDGRTDVVQVHRSWARYPVCLSTGTGWNCGNWLSTVYDIGTY